MRMLEPMIIVVGGRWPVTFWLGSWDVEGHVEG